MEKINMVLGTQKVFNECELSLSNEQSLEDSGEATYQGLSPLPGSSVHQYNCGCAFFFALFSSYCSSYSCLLLRQTPQLKFF